MADVIWENRLRFSKTGRMKYISHLDLLRCIQRTVCRASLPVAYSGGFHQRMQTLFAATLTLGFQSVYEILQLKLTEALPYAMIQERLNDVLPDGIRIETVGAPQCAFSSLTSGDYIIQLKSAELKQLQRDLEVLLAQSELIVEKSSKKGLKQVDIHSGMILLEERVTANFLCLQMNFPVGNKTTNPMLLLNLLKSKSETRCEIVDVCRIVLWDEKKKNFFEKTLAFFLEMWYNK
ncbi:MAG: TIGR03936 family radical SAM-associated protein [Ruminococcus sp.]|nr:TIGR03936 family radical SAM-associated protein [Ruminococcus sp.]